MTFLLVFILIVPALCLSFFVFCFFFKNFQTGKKTASEYLTGGGGSKIKILLRLRSERHPSSGEVGGEKKKPENDVYSLARTFIHTRSDVTTLAWVRVTGACDSFPLLFLSVSTTS